MRLKAGERAPAFRVQTTAGEVFDLNTPRKKPLLLAFFRYASCPLCNLRVHELIQNHKALSEVADIVLVFQSPTEKIEAYVGRQSVPYPIIPDPERRLYALYKVEASWGAFFKAWSFKAARVFRALVTHRFRPGSVEGEIHRVPADFLIDENNTIRTAFYGKDIGDHLPLTQIYQKVREI